MDFFLGLLVDRFSLAIDLSTSESKVLRWNPWPGCQYFVSFDHFKIDRGCIFVDYFCYVFLWIDSV